ncbi:DinB family protein [Chryseotalea sanaruensis]|uniref:DinB family protein n=1 Tax=Chryseotalea sanaruensis TaxID=2482724 RepID=A0A401U780_9BACT|nr:DinB family protein [Chryseotalea sanaruensis]GCC50751.1 DinB family protein [Chryseotalea sanaruensis]
MNSQLEKHFHKLEEQRTEILNSLLSKSATELSAPPAPGKWSVLQILTHLYASEKLSFGYIKKKSLGIQDTANADLRQAMVLTVLKISQRLPFRFRAPKVVVENTPETMSLEQLVNHWNLLRLELKAHLENVPDGHLHKLVYKHPMAGRLSLPQALQFFAEHINHHKPQIKKALKF